MSTIQISERYARALYDHAQDAALDDIHSAVRAIGQLIDTAAEFREFLANPLLDAQERTKVLNAIFEVRVPPLLMKFLLFINHKNRLGLLREICRSFELLFLRAHHRISGQVQTALPLEVAQKDRLSQQLSKRYAKEMAIEWQIRKEILGGFRILIDGTLLDCSFTSQLERYRQNVLKK